MKIKNSQVVTFLNGVADIQSKMLPTKVGYAIARNIALLESVAKAYEEERTKIIDKYAKKGEDGRYIVVGNTYDIQDMAGFGADMDELLGIENEVAIHTVSLSELEKCDLEQFDALTVKDLKLLDFMTVD
ncbi:Uncharacterised protein [[Eubacterium] contortum]|uniref:Uncharacterized protein n=1 Tax=Faecalicatena contorta TaxID=39482 RepID=A0A174LQS0_9FIRM|nr:hypothetical protein [Faecalicatena contorta]CUP25321.1 Uncharacterised protein [[Eubacterium] contortum] [Faecalicatena contorta]